MGRAIRLKTHCVKSPYSEFFWSALGLNKKKTLWMGLNYLKAKEPLRGGSLLFTTKFSEIPDTHLIDLGRMKGRVDL